MRRKKCLYLYQKKLRTMIYYSVKKKKSPKDGTVKYYGVSTLRKSVSQKMIEEEVKSATALERGDVQSAVTTLAECIKKHLMAGDSVKLDELGTFSLTFTGKGVVNEEDYKPATCITKFNVQFRPSVALRKAVQDTKVQKIELSNDVSNGSDVDPNA